MESTRQEFFARSRLASYQRWQVTEGADREHLSEDGHHNLAVADHPELPHRLLNALLFSQSDGFCPRASFKDVS
jgi:hypothetical protein